jgi:hypothetical protein
MVRMFFYAKEEKYMNNMNGSRDFECLVPFYSSNDWKRDNAQLPAAYR